MSLKDAPISRKLGAAFAALVTVFLAVGLPLYFNLNALDGAARNNAAALTVAHKAQEMMNSVLEQQSAVRAYVIGGDRAFLDIYEKDKEDLRKATAEFSAATPFPEQKERASRFLDAASEWQEKKLDVIVGLASNPATLGQAQRMAGAKQLEELRAIMSEITRAQDEQLAKNTESEESAHDNAMLALEVGGVLAVGLAILLGWLLTRSIAEPVATMTRVMKRLAEGDHSAEVAKTDRRDEIGDMAQAIGVFRETAIAKEKSDREQKQVVEALSDGLHSLSEGDLTADIKAEFSPSYVALKDNFNEALWSLRTLIGSVGESAASIRTGSGEIAHASEDLARRTESNAASLEQTSASLVQIDGRLKATAVAAASTVERADQAMTTVGGGRSIADEAVQAMGRVSDSAKGIDSVIEGLDKIAFQTRVLAMNAAVEAGRAGDAGRGFAVVADLVSALAMRAEEEAKRARDQLTVTQTDIVTAVEAVEKVDGALAKIAGDVGQVHELLGTMAADNQAQSSAITEISAAIGTMDQSTQQNAAMVEETSAAARNLTSEVSALTEQAARFKVNATGAKPAAAGGAKPTTAKAYESPVKPLPAAAVKALVRTEDDWNAF